MNGAEYERLLREVLEVKAETRGVRDQVTQVQARVGVLEASVRDNTEQISTGRTSIKVLMWVGGAVGGTIALVMSILHYFKA